MRGTILYYGGFILPDGNAAAHRVTANGKIFRDLGYRVVYLGVTAQPESFDGIRQVQAHTGFEMLEEAYPASGKQWLNRMWRTDRLSEVAKRYPDLKLVILYNVPYVTLKRVQKIKAQLSATPPFVVYDCTEWCPVTDGSFIKKCIKRLDAGAIRNKLVKKSDALIVISKQMESRYGTKKPLLRMPPLTDLSDPIWHQEPVSTPQGSFTFCFAGVLDGNKEYLDQIVAAFASIQQRHARLCVIGVTKNQFLDKYPSLSESVALLNDQLAFTGRLSHAETVRYVLGCDCYIFVRPLDLRNNAGFPTKFAESYTAGVPIITTDVSDVAAYINDSAIGQVLSDTEPQTIAAAMDYAIGQGKNPEKGLRNTFDYHAYEKITQKWLDCLGTISVTEKTK